MALEVVGGAILSASLQALFGDIHSIVDYTRRNKVDGEQFNQLKGKLLSANEVLDDAERQQVTNPRVGELLEKLKDAIHDAEDLVDQIKTEDLRRELEADRRIGCRVCNFFSSRFTVKDVKRRINNIIQSVDSIEQGMERLGLKEGVHTTTPFQIQRSSLNVLVKESDVYGREVEKEAIIKFLLSDGDHGGDGGHNLSVMPIVGMGGMGKTTLAQLVYNMIDGKAEVKGKPFVIKAWITVSDESKSDVFSLTKAIYEKVKGDARDSNSVKEALFELQLKLREALEGKKFLFVLDDVWNVDHRMWEELKKPFESAASGSKIILTTRLPNIAKVVVTADSEVLNLELLSEEDCWKLFSKLAFNNVEPSSYPPDLVEIGGRIVKKCKGNPLAVKSLACFLHSDQNSKNWKEVLENDLWEFSPQREDDILPALWLSYYYLPRDLKRCFAFCSIIPKDFEFQKETLILLWMAEGLLQSPRNMKLEDVGEKYFEELTSRSFFDVDKNNKFTMHDLVNDLAKFVSGNSCLRLDHDKLSDNSLIRKTRHIFYRPSITQETCDKISEGLFENKVLRSVFKLQGWGPDVTQFMENSKRLASMQCLRVLCLRETCSVRGSFSLESIGKLKLLRYLDLSDNDGIDEMPDTICTLYNLQTLLLRRCRNLVRLPNSIRKLRHLRYLDLSDTPIERLPDTIGNLQELHVLRLSNYSYRSKVTHLPATITKLTNLRELDIRQTPLEEMPRGMSNLKNLQILGKFAVGKNGGSGIEELGNLQNLSGYLEITGLENVAEVNDASNAILENARDIRCLRLVWGKDHNDDDNKAIEVFDRLRPHPNIQNLRIANYGGRSFPDWVGLHSFSRMTYLSLYKCKQCRQLPPLGELPSLEQLQIRVCNMVERIGDEFCVAASSSSPSSPSSRGTELSFKSLKWLRFTDMPEWKEWSSSLVGRAFSNLEELELRECTKLSGACCLPGSLPSLKHLAIHSSNHHLLDSLARCDCPSLRTLEIRDCSEMKSFPQARLPESIESIRLWGCLDLESLSEEGWPCSSLKSLEIRECGNIFAHSSNNTNKWKLGMLTSLTSLSIWYMDMEGVDSFSEEEGQFPTTLTSLHLEGLENLKSLNGTAFRHLTSLQELTIGSCYQLECFPQERLLASLSELCIWDCPLLTPRYQRDEGQDRDKIHVPYIRIDN